MLIRFNTPYLNWRMNITYDLPNGLANTLCIRGVAEKYVEPVEEKEVVTEVEQPSRLAEKPKRKARIVK